jgi:hypothetical protein
MLRQAIGWRITGQTLALWQSLRNLAQSFETLFTSRAVSASVD